MIINEYANLFTQRQLKNNQKRIAKSIQNLSSGRAINKAADNAAGLAISEKLKSIVGGTSKASQNVQDGISFLQTADGGLNEVVTLLQRQRELALKAANGTLTPEDRSAIQVEIDQLTDEIDHISNDTEFNKLKALRPPIKTDSGGGGGKADIVFIIDATGSMGSYIDNVKDNINAFADALASEGIDYNLGLVVYRDIADPSDALTKYSFTNDADTFKSQLESLSATGGGDFSESGLEAIDDPAAGALTLPFRADASKQFVLVTDATVHDKDGDGLSAFSLSTVTSQLVADGIKTSIVSNSTAAGQLRPLADATGGKYLDIGGSFASSLNTIASDVIDDTTEDDDMPDLTLQTGADEGDTMPLSLFDSRAKKLGLNGLSVRTGDQAEVAIDKVDQALDKVSAARSRYGAYQNRLQHAQNQLLNYNENLASAQSGITDADMAKEVAELTKSKMQENVSEAMASQANVVPQTVLKLIDANT